MGVGERASGDGINVFAAISVNGGRSEDEESQSARNG